PNLFGSGFTGTYGAFPGVIDEVRVSSVTRSVEWILTEYRNQSSPSTFYSLGATTAASLLLNADSNMVTVSGDLVHQGGDFVSTGTVVFDSSVPHAVLGGNITTFTNVTISGSGALIGHPINMNVAGNFTNGGTFTHNSGTVTFTGSGTQLFNTGGGSSPFRNIVHSGSGTLQLVTNGLTALGTLTNSAGTVDLAGNALAVTGAVSNTGVIQLRGNESVTLSSGNDTTKGIWKYVGDGDGVQDTHAIKDFGAGVDYFSFTINDPNATKDIFSASAGNLDINGMFTETLGTFIAPVGSMNVAGDFTLASGTTFTKGGTLTLDGDLSFSDSTASNLGDLVVGHSPDTITLTSNLVADSLVIDAGDVLNANGYNLTITNSITINGTLNAATGASMISLGGNWTLNVTTGIFNAGSSTVTFTGTDQSLFGSTTFNNLSKTVSVAREMTFEEGKTQTINGALTLVGGADPNRLALRSTTSGTYWNIVSEGSRTLSNLDVRDSYNNSSTVIDVRGTGSIGYSQHNVRWIFDDFISGFIWLGTTSNAWNTGSNWSGGVVPGPSDVALFEASSNINCSVDVAVDVKGIDIQVPYSGTISQNAYTMAIGSDGLKQASGVFTGGSATITIGSAGNFNLSGGTFNAPSANFSVDGDWTRDGGVFNRGTGTVTFTGADSQVFGISETTFNHLSMTGTLTGHSTGMTVYGDWTNDGTFTHNSGTVTFAGASTILGSSTTTFNNIVIGAALTGHATNMNVAGNWTNNGTAFTHNSGTVTFTGTGTVLGTTQTMFNNLAISATGVLTGHATNMEVAGDWTNLGVFTHNSGMVTINGEVSSTSNISGSNTFFILKSIIPGKTIVFPAGQTQTFASGGKLVITGASGIGNAINLQSSDSVTPTPWNITHTDASVSVQYANVSNGGCVSSKDIQTGNSVNGGGNDACWLFPSLQLAGGSGSSTVFLPTSENLVRDFTQFSSQMIQAYQWTYNDGTAKKLMALNMPFNSGTTQSDFSGNGLNGTATNMVTPNGYVTSGRVGGAMSFDGTNDYISVSDANILDITSALTLSVWVYPTSFSTQKNIICKGDGNSSYNYCLYLTATNGYITLGGGTNPSSTIAPVLNQWSHIATTFNGATHRFYVNGTQVYQATGTLGAANAFPLYIGYNNYSTQYFNGSLDEVQIYPRALSAAQIDGLYHDGLGASPGVGGPTFMASTETDVGEVWDLPSVTPITDAGEVGSSVASANTVTITGVTLSGTCTQTIGGTPCAIGETIRYLVNGGGGDAMALPDGTGDWTFSNVSLNNNDVITVYVDGVVGEKAVAVTVYDGSGSPTGIQLVKQYLTIGSDTQSTVTNANLDVATDGTAGDINDIYTTSGSVLTMASGKGLYVIPSNTYAPGANSTVNNVRNDGTITGSNTMTVMGTSWINYVGGTVSFASGTVVFNNAGTVTIDGNNTWFNFTSTTGGQALHFGVADIQTVNGLLTLTGTSGNEILIDSITGVSQWVINHQGTENVSYANVSYSGCDAASKMITVGNGTDSGNNGSCWEFLGLTLNNGTTTLSTADNLTSQMSGLPSGEIGAYQWSKTVGTVGSVDTGDGSDGVLSVGAANTVVNDYAYITSTSVPSGSVAFNVNSASGFFLEDEILIIQMQHSTNAGAYEFASISAINGTQITVSGGLTNNYYSGTFNTNPAVAAQIVRVPQYTTVTVPVGTSIVATAWDGQKGGVVIFRATGDVTVGGAISAQGLGYRGGVYQLVTPSVDYTYGTYGENQNGYTTARATTTAAVGMGGGAGKGADASAGGGGYGVAGGNGAKILGGSIAGLGGGVLGESSLSTKLLFGGAGGSSGTHSSNPRYGATGGRGGGILYITGDRVVVSGSVSSGGSQGADNTWNSTGGQQGGGGGGGAGGSLAVLANMIMPSGTVSVSGGRGGYGYNGASAGGLGPEGGDGGLGRMVVSGATLTFLMALNMPFNLGTTQQDFSGNGNSGTATNGAVYTSNPANCKVGGCLQLTGDNEYVQVPDNSSLDITNAITVSAWVKGSAYAANNMILHKDTAYGVWYDWSGSALDNSEIMFMFYDSAGAAWRVCDSDFNPTPSTWYMFSATYDKLAQQCKFYVNGALNKTSSYSQAIANGGDMRIGAWNSAGYDFDGYIDEVQIYPRALSAAQISRLYTDGLGASPGVGGPTIVTSEETDVDEVWNLSVTPITDPGEVGGLVASANTVTITGVELSGTCVVAIGGAACADGETIRYLINGAGGGTTVLAGGTGIWTFSNVSLNNNDVITVYVDGSTGFEAVAVTVYDGSGSPTGIQLVEQYLTIGSDTQSTVTNANLDVANNVADADIDAIYTTSGSVLTMASGKTLFILPSNTYAPGANSMVNNVRNDGTITGSNTMTVTGTSWINNGTVSFASGTAVFNNATVTITGNNTWFNFTSTTAGQSIELTNGVTQTVGGLLTLTGASGNLIRLDSTVEGSQALIKHLGTEAVTYVEAEDIGCDAASTAVTMGTQVYDLGNNNGANTCLIFHALSINGGATTSTGDLISTVTGVDTNETLAYRWTVDPDGVGELPVQNLMALNLPMDNDQVADGAGSQTTVYDFSGEGNNGTLNGGVVYMSSGKVGGAMSFDGVVGSSVDVGNAASLNITGAMTISAWVNYDDTSGNLSVNHNSDVVSKVDSVDGFGPYVLSFGTGNEGSPTYGEQTFVQEADGAGAWTTEIIVNNVYSAGWHHVVAVNDGTIASLYVDGTVIGTDTTPAQTLSTVTENAFVGLYNATAGPTGNPRYFKGWIDELQIFDRALSDMEIQHLQTLGLAGNPAPTTIFLDDQAVGEVWTAYVRPKMTDSGEIGSWATSNSVTVSQVNLCTQGGQAADDKLTAAELDFDDKHIVINCTFTIDSSAIEKHTFRSVVINGPSGKLVHTTNTTSQATVIDITTTGDFTVNSGGTINVNALGFNGCTGPGRAPFNSSNRNTGGAYGGLGGGGSATATYGSVNEPASIGSGGNGSDGFGCVGGGKGAGAIKLVVGGTLTVNGTGVSSSGAISATGGDGVPDYGGGGGGSGGSIWINAGSLAGSGTIIANGGAGAINAGAGRYGGGGGGGRIAAYYTTTDTSEITYQAYGGLGYTQEGGAGSIYKQQGSNTPTLYIDNGGRTGDQTTIPSGALATWSGLNMNLDVRNQAIFETGNRLVYDADGLATLNLASVLVGSGGTIRHAHNDNATSPTPRNMLSLNVLGDVEVQSGGTITASSFGFNGCTGPGRAPFNSSNRNTGGAYGGLGGGGSA
ncbi:MAG: LamG-like jellyroll fold domain-containing protein, partial [Candidatus Gracilibacteria bacterium]|nr:LamG-like jellyroll fold domain-containing protein [Candidatus Gracilibacteria bacterium]